MSRKLFMNGKVVKIEQIKELITALKKAGKVVGALSGSFDMVHLGHIKLIEEAKVKCDFLVVLLNSDESIRSYKGISRPINDQSYRAEYLSALSVVDCVVIFNEINPVKVLSVLKPDIYFQGSDWGDYCIERRVVVANGGKIHVIERSDDLSSTALLAKIGVNSEIKKVKAFFYEAGFEKAVAQLKNKVTGYIFESLAMKKNSNRDIDCLIANGFAYFADFVMVSGVVLNESWLICEDPDLVVVSRASNLKVAKIGEKMPVYYELEPHCYLSDIDDIIKLL